MSKQSRRPVETETEVFLTDGAVKSLQTADERLKKKRKKNTEEEKSGGMKTLRREFIRTGK